MTDISLRDIYLAARSVSGVVIRTPLVRSTVLSHKSGCNVYLKLETIQPTGSFKIRGAANYLLNHQVSALERGVLAVSTGNHGRAVAYVAGKMGIPATICVPSTALPHKVSAIRQLGANVRIVGRNQDEAEAYALELADRDGLLFVSPFDDPYVIAGQGTLGLEILEELPEVDAVAAPLSGGGLLSGVALALKSASSRIRTIGVSMANGSAMYASLRAGQPVPVAEEETLADSLVGGIGLHNRYTFGLVQTYVDYVQLVDEAEIAAAMRYAFEHEHLVVEGGGAVALAALLHGKLAGKMDNLVIVLSGANADMALFRRIINAG